MNKCIILLLAICLVSVNAFVKRDTPEVPKTDILTEAAKKITDGFEDFKKTINTDAIQKSLEDTLKSISETIKNMKPPEVPKA